MGRGPMGFYYITPYTFFVFEVFHSIYEMFLKCNTTFMINLYEVKCYFLLKGIVQITLLRVAFFKLF